MMSPNLSPDKEEVQDQIKQLRHRLETEVERLQSVCNDELINLKAACEKGIESAQVNFTNKLKDLHHLQLMRIKELEQELLYLKEMNYSQHIMLKDKLQYIKELELQIESERFKSKEA